MKIVVDENIPLARQAFEPLGDVELVQGRALTPNQLGDTDALVVRSVTKVGPDLLASSRVRFVGTATIGTDHLDLAYLRERGIRCTNAAGSNARSVVEYVFAAIAEHCLANDTTWEGKTLGVVGYGNIGSRLAIRARGLGMKVIVSDPPLHEVEPHEDFHPLSRLLKESDFLSLHVPLTNEGSHATKHLMGAEELNQMKAGAVLINTSRGPVLDNNAALKAEGIDLVLDVFENEPKVCKELVRKCFLATPHIAGYSYDGKVNGTQMVATALSRFLNREVSSPIGDLDPPEKNRILLNVSGPMKGIVSAIRTSYDIREDDRKLRDGLTLSEEEWPVHFDKLRKNYPVRREFYNYRIDEAPSDDRLRSWLRVLHFRLH